MSNKKNKKNIFEGLWEEDGRLIDKKNHDNFKNNLGKILKGLSNNINGMNELNKGTSPLMDTSIEPKDFITFIRIEREEIEEENPNNYNSNPEENISQNEVDPNMDPNMNSNINDPSMNGSMTNNDPDFNSKILGRVFELKKIFARLTAIDEHLQTSSDIKLLKMRVYISDALELFKLLIANIDKFQDKIDEIIVQYYKFLKVFYEKLKEYFDAKRKKIT